MSEQENIRIVKESFDAVNRHDLDSGESLFSDDLQAVAPGSPGIMNKQQSRMYTEGFLQSSPDLHFDIQDIFGQGDYVAVTWVCRGTSTNPITSPTGATIPATGKTYAVPGSTVYKLENGLITEQKIYWDMVTLLTQTGVLKEQDLAARYG